MLAESEIILRLIFASLVGFVVGLERESVHKPAGIRTHMLVSLGSALFAIAALEIASGDIGRIIAGIATGIGFLGAGTIFQAKDEVHGLTTAASVWVVASIGLVAGLGLYFHTVTATVFILIILHIIKIDFFKKL